MIPVYMRTQAERGKGHRQPSVLKKAGRWEPSQLHDSHKQMIRLRAQGMKTGEIARTLGVGEQSVKAILMGELGQAELKKYREELDAETIDVADQLQEIAKNAVQVMGEAVDNKNLPMGIRLKAAAEVMDRAGYGKVTKVQTTNQHSYIAKIGIQSLKERAEEIEAIDIQATDAHARHVFHKDTFEGKKEIADLREHLVGSPEEAAKHSIMQQGGKEDGEL